jgi:tRNA-uridine 2-sulfurtransferase
MKNLGKKVFVGMSGGVDSSVSAALLKEAGYDVTGVFIKVWSPDWLPCTWKEERRDAMRVAAALNIPFITLDLENEYKKGVVDYMLDEYKRGRTPNPDVMCNKEVKFGTFLKKALEMGADFVATGHYAQIHPSRFADSPQGESPSIILAGSSLEGGARRAVGVSLFEGADKSKDQSYFLYTLKQEQLKHIFFPVGHLQKSEVRELATKFKLPTAGKKDSQGICFIGKVDMKEFLSHYIESKPGKVITEDKKIIGHHDGAIFYTIGQRHGFVIDEKTSSDTPYYIVAKNTEDNTLTVSHKIKQGEPIQAITSITLSDINSTNGKDWPKVAEARIRYRQQKQSIKTNGDTLTFSLPQDGVSLGQSIVIYDDEECLGGGIIEEVR